MKKSNPVEVKEQYERFRSMIPKGTHVIEQLIIWYGNNPDTILEECETTFDIGLSPEEIRTHRAALRGVIVYLIENRYRVSNN